MAYHTHLPTHPQTNTQTHQHTNTPTNQARCWMQPPPTHYTTPQTNTPTHTHTNKPGTVLATAGFDRGVKVLDARDPANAACALAMQVGMGGVCVVVEGWVYLIFLVAISLPYRYITPKPSSPPPSLPNRTPHHHHHHRPTPSAWAGRRTHHPSSSAPATTAPSAPGTSGACAFGCFRFIYSVF